MPIANESAAAERPATASRKASYSQYGEDREILKLFGTRREYAPRLAPFDGISLSNSYLLEKEGWQCVLVEPNPLLCDQIRETRQAKLFQNAATSSNWSWI